MNLDEIKEKIARACRIIDMEGVTQDGRGHISYLHPDGDKVLIPGHLHDYGKAIADVQPEDIVTMDFDGNVLEGKHPEPMGEFYVYVEAFRAREDVKSVAHCHPPYANIVAASGNSILPIARDGCVFYDGVPVYEGYPLYVGNRKMGEEVVAALGDKKAILHKGHGAFVVGGSVEETLFRTISLEKAAKTQVYAAILGELSPIPVESMTDREKHPDDHIVDDFFGYYSGKMEKLERQAQT
ncbi:MAG: class II aldolase/adducin family protein [Acidobacteriota bacterium]|nr:class II aldolase/adducin family protein [Acidobacteriota bacterium]